jgi:hypothetical protein
VPLDALTVYFHRISLNVSRIIPVRKCRAEDDPRSGGLATRILDVIHRRLDQIKRKVPPGLAAHIICVNLSARKSPGVTAAWGAGPTGTAPALTSASQIPARFVRLITDREASVPYEMSVIRMRSR